MIIIGSRRPNFLIQDRKQGQCHIIDSLAWGKSGCGERESGEISRTQERTG